MCRALALCDRGCQHGTRVDISVACCSLCVPQRADRIPRTQGGVVDQRQKQEWAFARFSGGGAPQHLQRLDSHVSSLGGW
eukprot:6788377-Prymnesium_polylepis.1